MTTKRVYSDLEITQLTTEGFIRLGPEWYDHLPKGSHVRYIVRGDDPIETRFRIGGYVKCHVVSDGQKCVILGNSSFKPTVTWRVCISDIEKLWKEYAAESKIEIHMIMNALAEKTKAIDELARRIEALERRR